LMSSSGWIFSITVIQTFSGKFSNILKQLSIDHQIDLAETGKTVAQQFHIACKAHNTCVYVHIR
jgi:hypothetical protein